MKNLFGKNLVLAACCGLIPPSGDALADPLIPPGQSLAATCANCHGTDGSRPLAGIPKLSGRPAAWLQAQMADFKSGKRPATIMHQIAKGYSDGQIEQLAIWLEGH